MALTLSKQFMRMISQNPNENQTGISLWTLEDIERAQAKQRELALAQATAGPRGGDAAEDDEDEAITPNVSVELLPAFSLSSEDGVPERAAKPAKGKDMEAAMALLGFMGPEA